MAIAWIGVAFAVALVLMLIGREVVTWYFKLTPILTELQMVVAQLQALRNEYAAQHVKPVQVYRSGKRRASTQPEQDPSFLEFAIGTEARGGL